MIVNLETVFHVEGASLPIEQTLDYSDVSWNAGFPFQTPVQISGRIYNRANVVHLSAVASFRLSVACDRCLTPLELDFEVPIEHVLVTQLSDEENDELILVTEDAFDLDPLISEDIFLSLPFGFLCREDCKGLCPTCGRNMNEGPCSCAAPTDSRLDALRQLLDQELTEDE